MQLHGCSDLVRARSQLVTQALMSPADRFLFIDADMVPSPDQLVELAQSERVDEKNALSGLYLARPERLAVVTDHEFSLADATRYVPFIGAGMGFAAVDRRTIELVRDKIPEIEDADGNKWHPYFLPLVVSAELQGEKIHQYLPEDYSFWWRLRTMPGVGLWLDTHLVVAHLKQSAMLPSEADLEAHFSRLAKVA